MFLGTIRATAAFRTCEIKCQPIILKRKRYEAKDGKDFLCHENETKTINKKEIVIKAKVCF